MATSNFPTFAVIVNKSFQRIVKGEAFVVDVGGDALYAAYLKAFPEGTNPIFKKVTEHDCGCCKQFIRRVGSVVSVNDDGTLNTVWSTAAESAPFPYNKVAQELREIVSGANIANKFLLSQKEPRFGAQTTRSQDENGKVLTWEHFFSGDVPSRLLVKMPDTELGNFRTTVQVFERGLKELSKDAVETVLGLIDSNNLYRGEEHKRAVTEFYSAQKKYLGMTDREKHLFVWTNSHGPAARFRNTVIGTLVQDISEGMDVERAVNAFETKVAPQNYKRTSAILTPGMVKKAMETIKELDLEPSLKRRFAKIEDISVNDVLWVDSGVKPLMKGGIADELMLHAVSQSKTKVVEEEKKAEDISLDDFIKNILPTATGMEALFKGEHLGNLMSLTAPVHPEPKQLFRWTNDFAWSYGGNVADSIKERVKKAGGNVTNAKLRISLSWFNHDDLDLHVKEPGGHHIYFGSKRGRYGELDVDMNAGGRMSREPVENVAFTTVPDGKYEVIVHNFHKRESVDVGFTVEVESRGKLMHFSYSPAVRDRQEVPVVTLTLKNGEITNVESGTGIVSANISQEKWGLKTERYVKVNAVTLSPNYWGENKVGNKHTFFVLDGCKNDEPTRGIYNEFLHPRLEAHRKVFEIIGEKTKCEPTEGQLSGLGFSSTKKDNLTMRVFQGKKQRLFNINIGTETPQTKEKANDRQHV